MPGLNFGGRRKPTTAATVAAATTFTGAIATATSNALTVIVPKTMFKNSTPVVGWYVTYAGIFSRRPVSSLSYNGGTGFYTLTLSGSTFTTILNHAVTISTH